MTNSAVADDWSLWLAIAFLIVVPVTGLVLQYLLGLHLQATVLRKLCEKRSPGSLKVREGWADEEQGFWSGLSKKRTAHDFTLDSSDQTVGEDDRDFVFDGRLLAGMTWREEREHWDGRAADIRRSFLTRTQENAERWRTIFVGSLGLFAAVLLVDKPSTADLAHPEAVVLLLVLALVLALNAVAFTGWASAGVPKIMVNVDARSAFVKEILHGTRSLARLRIGMTSGGIAVVVLVLALVLALEG